MSLVTIADVSEWSAWMHSGHPSIQWSKVRSSGKVAGAIIRLGYGTHYVDHNVSQNQTIERARKAGVPIGFYLYATPGSNPVASANQHASAFTNIVNRHGGIQGGDLGGALDVETTGGLTNAQLVTFCQQWIAALTAAIPSPRPTLMIYSNLNFFQTHLSGLSGVPRWVADYGNQPPQPWIGWQYTNSASVPGIPGSVDFSHFDANAIGLGNAPPNPLAVEVSGLKAEVATLKAKIAAAQQDLQ